MESGKVNLENKPFNLRTVLRELTVIIEAQARECGLAFHVTKESGTHWDLIGSPVHLRQMLMNVMSNAVKYNKEEGSIFCLWKIMN